MARKSEKTDRTLWKSSGGIEIRLQAIDPLFVQTVARSVKIPDVPTYDTKTYTGRIETHAFDAKAAEQTPGGMEIWNRYQTELAESTSEQNDRVLQAVFLDGTVRPDNWTDAKWFKRMKIIGVDLPEDEDELWVLYLRTSLSQEDVVSLSSSIIRLAGVPEEMIEAAEEIFRESVRPDNEREESVIAPQSA